MTRNISVILTVCQTLLVLLFVRKLHPFLHSIQDDAAEIWTAAATLSPSHSHTLLPLEERILASFWLSVTTTAVFLFGKEQVSECAVSLGSFCWNFLALAYRTH